MLLNQGFHRTVLDRHIHAVARATEERDRRLASLNSAKAARAWCRRVKAAIHESFGPFPERTPLKPRVTGVVEREAYNIEKVLYESRPGYYVTALLYVPNRKRPAEGFPAVLAPCGHSGNGKACKLYQTFCAGLAKLGYMVLCYDPVSQGERGQFPGDDGQWGPPGPTTEHNLAGNPMSMVGEVFAMWRAWDGIRSLDYLLSRPEVNPTHVGVTGSSGGGTLSSYLNALDDRFTMAAPSCWVATYLSNLENELPADSEQCPPGVIASGVDMADFLIAQAPRPVILLGVEQDFFDLRGLCKAYEQVRYVYRLLGAEDHVALAVGPGTHNYGVESRQSMYAFFNRFTKLGRKGRPEIEPAFEPEPDDVLQVTEHGAVRLVEGNRFNHQFAADTARALGKARGKLTTPKLLKALDAVLKLPQRSAPPHFRSLPPLGGADAEPYRILWRYGLETEPAHQFVMAVLHLWDSVHGAQIAHRHQLPPAGDHALLYLPHLCSRTEVRTGSLPVTVDSGALLYSLDVRGFGELMAGTCNDRQFLSMHGADYFYACHNVMLGESCLGLRVHDVLSALDLLNDRGVKRVHLVGEGFGAVYGAMAAVLHPLVKQVTLRHALKSFETVATTPGNRWPYSMMPWGGLRRFDLPDVYGALERKGLTLIDPWDARMGPSEPGA